jgi:hypothetical protein
MTDWPILFPRLSPIFLARISGAAPGGAATTNLIGPFVNAYSRADTLKEVMHAEAIRKFLLFIWNAPDKGA